MKSVEFQVNWHDRGNNKIAAIKQLRAATNCGLKEAKEAVESADDIYRVWRMTTEQFGQFVIEHWAEDRNVVNFYLRDAVLIPPRAVSYDFTTS